MQVLLVDDQIQYASLVAEKLAEHVGNETTLVSDPHEAVRRLATERYDVVVVDLLYDRFSVDFNRRRLAHLVDPGDAALLISGLYVLDHLRRSGAVTRPVLWTSGDENRQLHVKFAFEELGVRSFCSKGSRSIDALVRAVKTAGSDGSYIDPIISTLVPPPDSAPLRQTILRDPQRRAIWRALALGHHSREDIQHATHYSRGHIGNLISGIYAEDLTLIDPGLPNKVASPVAELIRYAAINWEFLLDDTVKARYP